MNENDQFGIPIDLDLQIEIEPASIWQMAAGIFLGIFLAMLITGLILRNFD